jgi:M6 family metalloprotease-like protein
MKKTLLIAAAILLSLLQAPAQANSCASSFLYPAGKSQGVLKYKVIFVKYPNSSKSSTKKLYKELGTKEIEKYFLEASDKKAKVKFDAHHKWINMDNASHDYEIYITSNRSNWLQHENTFFNEVMSKADAQVDFSGYNGVIMVTDYNDPFAAVALRTPYVADGTPIHGVLFNSGQQYLLAHEVYHTLGLRDLYKHGQYGQTSEVDEFSIMSLAFLGVNPLGYEKYQLGWMDSKSVICHTSGSLQATLTPLDSKGGTQVIISPINPKESIVVEYRRPKGVDKYLNSSGVIVYYVNTDIPSGQGPISLFNDVKPIKSGEVNFSGINIKINKSKVSISR